MLGHYYQCPACERDLVLRLPPVTREIFYLASAIGFAAAVWWGGSSWITAAAIFFGISDAAARVYCGEISVKSQVKHPKRDLSTILLTIAVVAGVAFVAFTTTLIGGIWVPLIFIGGSCCVVC